MGICIQKNSKTAKPTPERHVWGRAANTLEQTHTGLAVTNKSSG
ncbi:hypothetical protein [Moorena sp. SIO3H5]|nr:hypothetical protein [Moorena sp. SIO3H5]